MSSAPASTPRRLALFDLDGTLIPGDSDHAFGEFMVALGWVDAEAHRRSANRCRHAASEMPPHGQEPCDKDEHAGKAERDRAAAHIRQHPQQPQRGCRQEDAQSAP